ncbi:aldo/keto reductase [Streptomyces sp. NBC_01456]|uniref:aldo/keto reductase n=1 Tax=Streptomyces sp. NBC_01456 TaxID=2975868 RepID=UPI002E33E7CD|nr:aldo/keto reductase [Streptomyces sp. NBC_01456]
MQKRHLPGLGQEVSAIGAGCWTIGGLATNRGTPIGWQGVSAQKAFEGLCHAFDLGVTLYDTADVYGLGRSERLLGRLLAQVDRSRLTVSSKVGYFAGTAAHPYVQAQILRQFATTCENLGTDYLDVYFLHSTDFGPDDQHLDEAVETLRRLRREGSVRALGMRAPHEFAEEWAQEPGHPQADGTARFLELFGRIRPDVLTVRHNMLSPVYGPSETDIFAFARRHGVGVLIKQALGQGLLLAAHTPERPPTFPTGDHRRGDSRFSASSLAVVHAGLDDIGRRFGSTRADRIRVALGYALAADPSAAVLVGFRDAEQINANLTSIGEPLSPQDIGEIRTAMSLVRDKLFPHQTTHPNTVESTTC